MAYVFSTNNAPADGNEAVFQLKAAMVAAGWTVLSSGTGNAGAGSGAFGPGDLLTTAALCSNSGSWFIIESPAGAGSTSFGFQHYKFGSGFGRNWTVAFDPVSSWGPAAVADDIPTGASGVWFVGNGNANQFPTWLPADATYAWNICCDNAAPYPMWAAAINLGGGSSPAGMMLEALTGAPPGDLRPYIVSTYNSQFGDGIYQGGNFGPFNAWVSGAYDPALVTGSIDGCPGFYLSNVFGQQLINNSVMNPLTNKDELYPILYARVAASGGAWQGLKGVGVMAYNCGTARAIGDTYTVTTPRDRIRLGNNLALPWDGSVPVF